MSNSLELVTDERIEALFQKYGTGRLEGFREAVREALAGDPSIDLSIGSEREGFAVEAALEFGFKIVDDDATMYCASGAQILALLEHVKKHSSPTPEAQQFEAVGRWLMTHLWLVKESYDRNDPTNPLTQITITSKASVTAASSFYANVARDILGAKS